MKEVSVIIDTETGVNYLFVVHGYAGGLTPLLDKNGKPVITPPNEIIDWRRTGLVDNYRWQNRCKEKKNRASGAIQYILMNDYWWKDADNWKKLCNFAAQKEDK